MPSSSLKTAIGIDLGGTFLKGGVVSADGESLDRLSRPTDSEKGLDAVVQNIADVVDELCRRNDITDDRLLGIGVGIPGVTTSEGVVILAPNLDWHHVPFLEILQEKLGKRIEVDNDANVAALAEAHIGVGDGCQHLVLLTLGTGIGGGVVLGGRIHHGASHSAGEIGHTCVLPNGPVCRCGKPGCLEALASGPAMVRQLISRDASDWPSGEPATPELICRKAAEGDADCLAVVQETAGYIGIAVANIINLLSPEVIAIGGGISAAGETILNPIIDSARANTLEGLFEHTRIQTAALGNDAGYLGAAHLVL
jgi:glucokinase